MSTAPDPTSETTRSAAPTAARASERRWRAVLSALAAASVVAVAGCGAAASDGAGGSGGGGADADEPTIEATFDISGSVTVKKTITAVLPANKDGSKPKTCEEYAKGFSQGGRTVLQLPNFVATEKVDGHTLKLDGQVSRYNGPGSYSRADLSGTGNPIGFSIDSHALVAKDTTNATVTINPDGSGGFTFDTLSETSTGIAAPQSISGKLSWKCRNP